MSKQQTSKAKGKQYREIKYTFVIVHNVQNSESSQDSTYKTDIDASLMEAGLPER